MAQSRKNKKRKHQLTNFKQKHKQQMSNQQQPQQSMPLVRNIPIWDAEARISVTGYEWEAIQNALGQLNIAQQAAQSVVSRNLVEGTIKMKFEKLNPLTVQYEDMTAEEQAPYVANFEKMIADFKAKQAEQEKQKTASPILTQTGEQQEPAKQQEKAVRKTRSKVVKLPASSGA